MKKKPDLQRLCILAGILLLIAAGAMMIFWQWNIRASRDRNQEYVQTLRALTPQPQNAAIEERRDNSMAVLSLEGTDFMGILEFPRFDSQLPVGADWGSTTRFPRCLSGSIYNSSLQIGATTQAGQYDFYTQISVGDMVTFTDMEGNRYTLAVTDLRYEKHADQNTLTRHNAPLTLFIKNIYAFEYLIVFCDIPR